MFFEDIFFVLSNTVFLVLTKLPMAYEYMIIKIHTLHSFMTKLLEFKVKPTISHGTIDFLYILADILTSFNRYFLPSVPC